MVQPQQGLVRRNLGAEDWFLCLVAPEAAETPDQLPQIIDWFPAQVPGTVAASLAALGRWQRDQPSPLHDHDVWYRCHFTTDAPSRIHFAGLASIATVFLNGEEVLHSRSMMLAHDLEIDHAGGHDLAIRFHALNPLLASAKGPRARWRPAMITPAALRFIRTSPLGFMPGWCPSIDTIGPWRDITLSRITEQPALHSLRMVAGWEQENATIDLDIGLDRDVDDACYLSVGENRVRVPRTAKNRFAGKLTFPGLLPWLPHTHGEPHLYKTILDVNGVTISLGDIGFRQIEIDRGGDGHGFSLRINGIRVFARGAVWTPLDPVGFRDDPEPMLRRFQGAGLNMVRLSGTMVPETPTFHAACDRLGIMVWQDLPFANFDYPFDDPEFRVVATAECRQLMSRLQVHPSTTVLCGGSEIAQQATMMGLAPARAEVPFLETTMAALARDLIPDVPYVPHTPFGGALPFQANVGVTHYFGVGAYRRPVEDARRAEVRFATESLAFANVPAPSTLRRHDLQPGTPRWKAAVPRDAGAEWDFEDIRDHYLKARFGIDPSLREIDPTRYLDLSRMVSAALIEAVFTEWRRPGSTTGGGLVWF
ncbi:MAG: glycoside hydrolase family 2 protein, partial [Alphaproteobacteria bacterium]